MAAGIVEILWSCIIGWFYVYSVWLFSSELLYCAIPLSAVGSVLLFIIVNFLRVPPPDASIVDEILGSDPWIENQVENIDEETNASEKYLMKNIAHRGAGLDAPENSITAIKKTKEKGCTAVEIDITLTADDIPILFHDSHVDRITEATGEINEMLWEEVEQLDIASKHPFRNKFPGEKIPKFEEAIKECLNLGLRVFLDLKGDNLKMVPVILEAFKTHEELYTRAVVSSFNPVLIYSIRRANPRIVCSLAWRPHFFSSVSYSGAAGEGRQRHKSLPLHLASRVADIVHKWAFNYLTYYVLGLSVVLLHKDIVTAEIIQQWRLRGVRVIAWTVNLPSEKQFFSRVLKVTYMTDTLDAEIE